MNASFFFANAWLLYLIVLTGVTLTGYLIPIPEEVMLISIGYLASLGIGNPHLMTLASILGLLMGDGIIFFLSLHGARFIERFKNKISPTRLERYESRAKNHLGRYVFGLRFVPTLRFLSPIMAASLGVSWRKFIWYDALAVLIYAPILIFFGYHFGSQLALLLSELRVVRHALFVAFLIALGVWMSVVAHRKFYRNRSENNKE